MVLSEAEIKMVQETFAVVSQDKENNGKKVLVAFFTKHPDYLVKFPKFKGLTLDQVKDHPFLETHAVYFLNVLGDVVEVLGHPEKQKSRLGKLGKFHASHDVQKVNFQSFKVVLLEELENTFKLNKEQLVAWGKTMDVVIDMISAKLKK